MAKSKPKKPPRESQYGEYPGPNSFKRCYTVGELKKALEKVPDALPLNGEEGLMPIWYNVGYPSSVGGINQEHLNFEQDPEMDDF